VKLDGERMLIHKIGTEVHIFTRRRNPYTDKYGEVVSRIINKGVSAYTCIIDAEIVTWNDTDKHLIPFGELQRLLLVSERDSTGVHT
jgi:ATP-dependent DNA ligase